MRFTSMPRYSTEHNTLKKETYVFTTRGEMEERRNSELAHSASLLEPHKAAGLHSGQTKEGCVCKPQGECCRICLP